MKDNQTKISPELRQKLIGHFGQFPYYRAVSEVQPNFSNDNLTKVQTNLQLGGPKASAIFWILSFVNCTALEYNQAAESLTAYKSEVKNLQRLRKANLNYECGFVLKLRVNGKIVSIPINDFVLREELLKVVDVYKATNLEIALNASKSFSMLESKITSILCNLIFGFLLTIKDDLTVQVELRADEIYLLTGYILLCSNWRIFENKLEDKQKGYRQMRKLAVIKFDSKFQKNLIDKVRNRIETIKKNKQPKRLVSQPSTIKAARK